MSDLFHEKMPLEFVQQGLDTMPHCPQHTYQVLTKRSQPIPQDELTETHHMLQECPERWASGEAEEQQRLLNMILCRVWVLGDRGCVLMLRPSYDGRAFGDCQEFERWRPN